MLLSCALSLRDGTVEGTISVCCGALKTNHSCRWNPIFVAKNTFLRLTKSTGIRHVSETV